MTTSTSTFVVSAVCLATVGVLAASAVVGASHHDTPQQTTHSTVAPDITVAPCQWFTTHTTIPAYTRLDVCVSDNGAVVSVPVN